MHFVSPAQPHGLGRSLGSELPFPWGAAPCSALSGHGYSSLLVSVSFFSLCSTPAFSHSSFCELGRPKWGILEGPPLPWEQTRALRSLCPHSERLCLCAPAFLPLAGPCPWPPGPLFVSSSPSWVRPGLQGHLRGLPPRCHPRHPFSGDAQPVWDLRGVRHKLRLHVLIIAVVGAPCP